MRISLAALFALLPSLLAQLPNRVPAPESSANLPAQSLGANDLVAVSVYGAPELSRTIRVGADGLIRLPMLTERIKAEGLNPADLEIAIAKALDAGHILNDPFVTVTVAEYYSRPISVAGAVRTPLVFQASAPVTLLGAIARAGGLREDAGSEILVSRAQPDTDGKPISLTQRIPVRSLIDAADPALNVKLSGGEEVRVPEVHKIYVIGNVNKPGAFPVQNGGETTVLELLALAEGLAPFSTKEAYIYRREGRREGASLKNEIPIALGKIMKRQSPDVPLEANDILYIPDNKGKRLTASTIQSLIGFGTATSSGILIYKH